jgi:hypothetical protein
MYKLQEKPLAREREHLAYFTFIIPYLKYIYSIRKTCP